MKKFLLNLVLLAVLCFPVAICAQTIVEIGSSAGTSYKLPLNMEYKYSLTQQIYKADEIEVAGTISSVSFYYRNTSPMLIQRLRLYMMHTAKTSFVNNDDIVSLDTATLVYEGDFAADSTGWFTLALNNAFEYNGTDNLLICFCDTVIDDSLGTNYKFRCSGSIVNYTSISYYSNTDIPDVNDLSVYGGSKERYTYRSNIRLGITPAPGRCFKPTSLAVTDETAHGALVSWTAREGETAWQICLNDDEDSIINVDTNPYELTGLTPETTYTVKVRTTCYEGAYSGWTSNVSFTTSIACPAPTGLTESERSTTTATITWEAGGNESEWQVCINNYEDNLIDVTENQYTLTGLTPNSQTRVKVRANCGEEGHSNWVNIYVLTDAACRTPTALTCTPDVHSATISWTAGADETLWNIQYKVTSESNYTNVNGLTSPTYTITGLASGTAYTVMVQGDCGDNGTSFWRSLNFTTKYGIPFLEEFEDTPDNWSRGQGLLSTVLDGGFLNINSSSGWTFCSYNYNLNGVFDSHAYVNLWGSSRKEWLITPNIVMDANVQLTFDLALTKYSGTLQPVDTTSQRGDKFIVLISTDDGATWTILRQYDNVGSEYVFNNIATAGENVLIGLADYSTDNVKIAFYGESTVTGGDVNIHIDNVKLDYIRPFDLTVSNITATTADVAWNNVPSVLWELKYGIHGFNVENEGTLVENITQTSYSINGLLANTNYDVYVRAACMNAGDCEWAMVSFRTDCGIQAIPYIQTFDDVVGSRVIPPCWQRIVESNEYTYVYPVVSTALHDYTGLTYSGTRYMLMKTTDDSPQNIIALPQMSDINTLTISFWAKYSALANIPESFQIGYMSNGEFTPLESITLTENYRQYAVSLNAVPTDADRIAIEMYNSTGDSKVSIDDIEVNYIQSCPRPINVNIASVTTNSAVVTWTPVGEEAAWQYTLDNGITWNNFESTPAGTTTMEATITGLTINTDYSLKLRAYCSDSEQSEASYEVPFFTAQCESEDMCEITYSLFDSYGLGWFNSALKVVDVETGRALKVLTMPTDTFATGTISVCHGKEIRFAWMGTMNDPDLSYTITDVNGYEIFHVSNQQTVPVSYIVDCTIPDCPRPRDLAVSNVNAHYATISWTSVGSETAWQVCVNGEEDNVIDVTETTYTISGLLPESDYTVKVRANCSDSVGVSDWSNSVSFTTLIACPVPTNLTVSNIDMSSATLTWTAGRDETAWQLVLNDDEDNIIDLDVPFCTITGLSSGTEYNVKVRANCESDGESEWTNVYEFSTAFCEAEDQCDIIYSLSDSYGDGWEGSLIKVLDAETDVLITTLTVRDGESQVDGRIPVCDGRQIKFVWVDGGGFFASEISYSLTDANNNFFINNISDTSIVMINCSGCIRPSNLQANNVGSTWFDLSWTAGADETEWQICRAFDFDNAIDVNSNSYVMTGLRPETHYLVCLRAKCQEDSYSNWLIQPFATLARCHEPTNLIASTIDTTYATLSWSSGGDETAWQICINNDLEHIVDVNDTTYTLTNLIGGLEYTVMVRANCGYEPSEWVETTFITLSSCYAPRELAVSDVSSTSALVTWEGESDSYVIWYRTAETDGVSYFTDFEEGLPVGWTTIDNDEDGYCWQSTDELGGGFNCHSGTVCMTSASFENSDLFPLEPDNWLVSPRLALDGTLKVWLRIQDVSYPDEHFGIFVSTRGNAVADFTAQVLPETVATEEYTEYTVDLSSFNGQMGYIAVRHYNSFDQFRLNLDDFGLYSEPIPAGEWIEATTTENYYEITNLAQGTEYDIQVRSICGDEQSAWSYKSSFATLIPTYTIVATAGENGTITPVGEITVSEGNDQVFMIIPDEGYRIENVLVDGFSVVMENIENNTYTFTNIIGNHTIYVTFGSLVSANMAEVPSVSIFPNPNNGTYNIVFGNISGSVTYQLYDARGAMVETRDISVTNDKPVIFNHNLIPGTYFVRIIADDKVFVEKLVVE